MITTDFRGVEGHAWFDQADRLDLAALQPEELRRLLAEAMEHVRRLLESSDEADTHEAACEREGTHLTVDGMAAVIRGEDLGTVREALESATMWAAETAGSLQQVAKYRAIARALDEDL